MSLTLGPAMSIGAGIAVMVWGSLRQPKRTWQCQGCGMWLDAEREIDRVRSHVCSDS